MDLTAARAELQARGFDYLSTARCDIALNNAKNAFEEHWRWPWLEATITGPSPLSISDVKHILYVIDTTDRRQLYGLGDEDIADLDTDITTAGTPQFWWLDGGTTLKTYPTSATASLSVRYSKFSPELSAGSDTPLIPARHHPIWLDLAVVEAAKDDNDFQGAQTILQDALRRLDRLIEVYNLGLDRQAVSFAALDW